MSYCPPPQPGARPATLEDTPARGRHVNISPRDKAGTGMQAQGQGTVPSDEESGK